MSETLGPDHPIFVRLLEAEQDVESDEESELAEALAAYTDPTHPEFDRDIRTLRPEWFESVDRN